MADDAPIGDTHVRAGVVAGDGGTIIWPQLFGYARANEFLMNARAAERMGLVNHVVPRADLDRIVLEMAQRLANGPRDAIRWSKVCANVGAIVALDSRCLHGLRIPDSS